MDIQMFLPLLVAALLNLVLGAVWFSEKVFGGIWMKEIGYKKNKATKDVMISAMVTSFLCALVTGYVLLQMPRAFSGSVTDMLASILVVWVGFVAAIRLSHFAFELKSFRLFWIVSLFDLVNLLVMGLLFYYW